MGKRFLFVSSVLLSAMLLTGCEVVLPESHILVQAKATKAALQNEKLAAEVRVADARAYATEASKDALAQRNRVLSYALAASAAVLLVGGALGAATWLNKAANETYPNKAGQFPVMRSRNLVSGSTAYHDPNKQLGAGATYDRQGRLTLPDGYDSPANQRVTSQAQMVQLGAGATRHQEAGRSHSTVMNTAKTVFTVSEYGRIPEITVIEGDSHNAEQLEPGLEDEA